jgi:hypothetical protein
VRSAADADAHCAGCFDRRLGAGERQALLTTLLTALVVAAWSVLWAWSASPYRGHWRTMAGRRRRAGGVLPRYSARRHRRAGIAARVCLGAMIAAMMLPTTSRCWRCFGA